MLTSALSPIPLQASSFNPERVLGDTLTCAESSDFPNAMTWTIEHSGRNAYKVFHVICQLSPAFFTLTFVQTRHSRRIYPATHVAETELDPAMSRCFGRSKSDHYPMNQYRWIIGQSSRRPELYRIILKPRHNWVQGRRKRKSR
jgi:hypothetical protein